MKVKFILAALVVCVSCGRQAETADEGWISLFNGKDLSGWEAHGCGKFYVDAEGNLVTENGPEQQYGYLMTDRNYDDFDLRLEFLQQSDGNSGVFFRTTPYDYNLVSGWQCEVAPKGKSTCGIYESFDVPVDGMKGRKWIAPVSDEQQEYLKEGEWNSLRLRVQAGRVQTWLNDKPVADINDTLVSRFTGRIMLQIHAADGVVLKWRNIKLLPLGKFEDDPTPFKPTERVNLFNGKDLNDWDICVNPERLEGPAEDAFKVEDGIIKVSGICLGGITTKTAWRDYRLHVEFRFTGEGFAERKGCAADGGLLFHCVGPEGSGWKDTWHLSFESNMMPGGCCDMIMVECNPSEYSGYLFSKAYVDSRRCWAPEGGQLLVMQGNKKIISPVTYVENYQDNESQGVSGPERPYGEWNEMELVCDADRAEFFLNGVKTLEFFDLSPSSGRIQFQSEHHGIEYRNIYVEPIR